MPAFTSTFPMDVLVKASFVLLMGFALNLALFRASAARRHLVWLLSLGGALLMPAMCAMMPQWRVLPTWSKSAAYAAMQTYATPARDVAPPVVAIESKMPRPLAAAPGASTASEQIQTHASPVLVTGQTNRSSRLRTPIQWAFLIWFCGFAMLLTRVALSWVALGVLGKRAHATRNSEIGSLLASLSTNLDIRRPVTLLISSDHAMPMTWGIVFPKVLVPIEALEWPAVRVRMALLHELAHVKRWDALAQLLAQLTLAIYWFHPLAWLAARGVWRQQERSADDLVLSIERQPADYAQLLLDLAARRCDMFCAAGAIAMARRGALESRMVALLDDGRRRGPMSLRWLVASALLMLMAVVPLAALRAHAQTTKPTSQPAQSVIRVAGHVLAPDGKPIPGAQVVSYYPYYFERPQAQITTTQTNSDGAFALEATPQALGTHLHVEVRAPGFAIGSAWVEMGQDNRITMAPPGSIQIFFQTPDGVPAMRLRIRPIRSTMGIPGAGDASWVDYPPAWSQDLAQVTDDDGVCTFSLPRQARTQFWIDDPHYAQLSYHSSVKTNAQGQSPPATIRLTHAGSIRGKVIYADSGKPASGVHLISGSRASEAAPHGIYGDVVTDAAGEYSIGQMGAAAYVIHLEEGQDFPWVAEAIKDANVAPDQITYVPEMKLLRGCIVSGRVFLTDSGKPLSQVEVSAVDRQTHEYPGHVTTDADGKYSLRLPPGRMGLYLPILPPQGYSMEGFDARKQLDLDCVDGQDIHIDLKLTPIPGKSVSGRVLDPAGQPAGGARLTVTDARDPVPSGSYVTADDKGNFVLRGISSPTQLTAALHKMSNVSPVIVNGGENNVILQLAAFNAVTVTGTITDLKGQPQKNVWIKVGRVWGDGSMISGEPDLLSDAQGRFTVPPLMASGSFFLQVGGERFWEKRVDLKFSPDNPTLDLGQIKLEPKY